VLVHCVLDGELDLVADGFVTLEHFDDGEVDDGPEFDLGGRVSGIGGDEDELVVGGEIGEGLRGESGVSSSRPTIPPRMIQKAACVPSPG